MKYNYRYIARIVIEAETPIAVGSGNKEISSDRPLAKDANGLPFIPGTSLAGVLSHSIYASENDNNIQKLNDIFGFQDEDNQENSLGSRLAISSAHLIGKKGKVFDGLCIFNKRDDDNYEFINRFLDNPVREHVRISHKGAADTENYGKFDEEVLYKGSRFMFEIEMKGCKKDENEDKELWDKLLLIFCHPDFRIGGGSTKGFGKIKIIKINYQKLDLELEDQRETYLNHSSSLDSKFEGEPVPYQDVQSAFIRYELNLKPDDFYLFSSGLKSEIAIINQVMEEIIEWDKNDNPVFTKELILLPASSIKGAISHRVAYHYNKLEENFADKLNPGETINDFIGENNLAVKALFGESSDYKKEKGQKGKILFSDIYRKTTASKKLDHVANSRLTGGAIDGALYNENVVKDSEFTLELLVNPNFSDRIPHEKRPNINKALKKTLIDICSGILPLGGGSMRGNGRFSGNLNINKNGKNETLYTK